MIPFRFGRETTESDGPSTHAAGDSLTS